MHISRDKAEFVALEFILKFSLFFIPLFLILPFIESVLSNLIPRALCVFIGCKPMGNIIIAGRRRIEIIGECTAALEMTVLFSAIMATREKRRKKLIGLAVLIPLTILFNLLRIYATLFLLESELAALAHDFLFRISIFTFVFTFYALWLLL